MLCPQCGRRMKSDYPDKTIWFNCAFCGDRFFKDGNGKLVNVLDQRSKNGRKCENCGQPLAGGNHTAPWENGSNSNESIRCPHCHHINYIWEDD